MCLLFDTIEMNILPLEIRTQHLERRDHATRLPNIEEYLTAFFTNNIKLQIKEIKAEVIKKSYIMRKMFYTCVCVVASIRYDQFVLMLQ